MPLPDFPGARDADRRTKPLLKSMTIYGALLAVISRFTVFKVSPGEGQDLLTQAAAFGPLLAGLFGDLTAMVKRVRATKFNVDWYRSGVFWAAVFSGAMGALQAAGVDWSGLEATPDKVRAVGGTGGTFLAAILVIWGRSRASTPIGLPPPQDAQPLGIMPPAAAWMADSWDRLANVLTRPIITSFIRSLTLKLSRLDGKEGLTLDDLARLKELMVEAARRWQDNADKYKFVKEEAIRLFGGKLNLGSVIPVLDIVLVLWHAALKMQNVLPAFNPAYRQLR